MGHQQAQTVAEIELDYTQRMNADINWALREGGLFFCGQGEVHTSFRRITSRLNELGTNHAVVGGMALFLHGFRRYTENVNILVTREGLPEVHRALLGNGYRISRVNSHNIHDTENGVYIKFMVSDDVHDPQRMAAEQDGVWLLNLAPLLNLKLIFGMKGIARLKDVADVQEIIKLLHLPQDFAGQLSSGVRAKYEELWQGSQPDPDSEWQDDRLQR